MLLLGGGAAILGAADLRKANLEIHQALATGSAYRHLQRAVELESPAQWILWASPASAETPATTDSLFTSAVLGELRPAALDPATAKSCATSRRCMIAISRVGNYYLSLMASANSPQATRVWRVALRPLYLALSSRLNADADQEPGLVRWHLGRVAQVREVMWCLVPWHAHAGHPTHGAGGGSPAQHLIGRTVHVHLLGRTHLKRAPLVHGG